MRCGRTCTRRARAWRRRRWRGTSSTTRRWRALRASGTWRGNIDRSLTLPALMGTRERREGPLAAGGKEDLEGDAVGVGEGDGLGVADVLDAAVGDAELVEAGRPLLEDGAIGDGQRDVVEADAADVEGALGRREVLGEGEDELRVGLEDGAGNEVLGFVGLAEDLARAEEAAVPLGAGVEVAHAEFDVSDSGDGGH